MRRPLLLLAALLAGASLASAQGAPPAADPTTPTPRPAAQGPYLPPGRGLDWSLSGYREGRQVVPSPPPTINVRNFGARGDGQTDDTAPLQAAIKAANTSPTGGVIFLPAGTYILTRPLVVARGGVVIRGEGQGQTFVHIPTSLSEVYSGSWSMGEDGTISSSWSFGGAFLTFRGNQQSSDDAGTLLANINAPVQAGSRQIPVDNTGRFRVGQRVRIYVNDVSTDSRRRKRRSSSRRLLTAPRITPFPGADSPAPAPAAGGEAASPSAASAAADPPANSPAGSVSASPPLPSPAASPPPPSPPAVVTQAVPADLRSDPVFLSAMEGMAVLGEGGRGGMSPQEAAQADAAAADLEPSILGNNTFRMASPNTVVAWIYAENLVDSGSNGVTLHKDQVAVSAKVTEVGPDYIMLERGISFPVKTGAGWRGTVHLDVPSMQESGVENLTIRFKHTIAPCHFCGKGFNALQFSYGANCWVRNVTVLNADNALFFDYMSRSTIRGVTVGMTEPRLNSQYPDAYNGHHALSVTASHSVLVVDWNVARRYIHDLTLAWGANLNVFTQGGGIDCNVDAHRAAPFGNLFTELNMGMGTRPFASGGRDDRGAHSGRGNTFWSVRSGSGAPLALPDCDWGPALNFFGDYSGNKCPDKQWLVQPMPDGFPTNLFNAQREMRKQREAAAAASGRPYL